MKYWQMFWVTTWMVMFCATAWMAGIIVWTILKLGFYSVEAVRDTLIGAWPLEILIIVIVAIVAFVISKVIV